MMSMDGQKSISNQWQTKTKADGKTKETGKQNDSWREQIEIMRMSQTGGNTIARERVKKTARLKEHRYRQSQKQQVEIWTDKHVGRKTDGENDTNRKTR